jgi:HEAT repeat protein
MLADPTVQLHRHDLVRLLKDEAGEDRAAEALIALLGHDELWIRHDAISSLIDQCLGAAATRPALVRALDAADGGLRCEAAFYFLRQDPASASRALDVLIAQLLEPMEGGYLSLDIIRKLRDDSPASVGPVAARMAESLGGTAARDLNAILALAAIGPPEATRAVPALDRVAVSGERDVAIRAVALLATLDRRAAASHVPALLEWMGRGHPVESRLAAMNALGELGALAKSVVPKLIEAAEEDEIRISSAAIAALSRIDPPSGLALKRSILSGE